ncbi:putative protein binding protein [Corchorus olitorius]|uniref:Uncharacterized protein n=1 Tax=Corchorus olitorius TaxID=93759 RepID=A0A1R3HRB7_9ROSI|nr:putative protein binding protein [Corchorus olitorius]
MDKYPRSAIGKMLASMQIPVVDYLVDKILTCTAGMRSNDCYKNSKVLRMGVYIDEAS